jgi:hypothetical protein
MPSASKRPRASTPKGMAAQLARLFGDASSEAKATERTPAQWKRTLKRVLVDLERYLDANVATDEAHRFMLESGIWASSESLKDDDFWPGYAEGITRFALLLVGDYPDHRTQRLRGRSSGHYKLSRCRSVSYRQSHEQKLQSLFVAKRIGLPELRSNPQVLWREYNVALRSKASAQGFLNWYRKNHPADYASLF